MALNRSVPVPLYYQLAELIREQIAAGELRPGDQVPGERTLSEQYQISRMTARQALVYLEREGTLVSEQGRGTFVAAPKLTYDALHLLGFTEAMLLRGAKPRARVLEQGVVTPPLRVARDLGLAGGEEAVKIVRLRFSDVTPLLLETSYIPLSRCPGLAQDDLASQSLYTLLEQRYGVRLLRATQTLEATVANAYEQQLFGVAEGMPMILLTGVTFDDHNKPVEQFKAIYRGDRFKLTYESERGAPVGNQVPAPRLSMVLA
ncbi:MAG: GntR family transcriptional regulator [Chloroflexi bacterium OHK40]